MCLLCVTGPHWPGLTMAAGERQKILENGQMQPIVGGVRNGVREEAQGEDLNSSTAAIVCIWPRRLKGCRWAPQACHEALSLSSSLLAMQLGRGK